MSSPKTPSSQIASDCEFTKKIKRLRLCFEPSLSVIGLLIVSICVIFSFIYLDYRDTLKGFRFSAYSDRFVWLKQINESVEEVKKVEFLEDFENRYDVFDGDWVWDENYPLYESRDCRFMDGGFRCSENGRVDLFYAKWRWQPKGCNLPRFNATLMLEKLRNKRVVFIGDSIGRNQWESLLCMLSSAVPDKDSVYEVNGNPITKHKGFLIFKFKEFNCTVEYYRAPYLVVQGRPPAKSPSKIQTTLKLDQMDWSFLKWRDADVLVFNSGHWWNYEKTIRGGCYFQEGDKVQMDMDVDTAYKRSIETVVDWIHKEVNPAKTQVFFRTYSPVHFRAGNWKTGGSCNLETLPDLGSSLVPFETHYKIVDDVFSAYSNASSDVLKLWLLNITGMSSQRKDGHMSIYYLGPNMGTAPLHRQDCSHWCLPGVPDAWNELLYAFFLKREVTQALNSSTFQPHT